MERTKPPDIKQTYAAMTRTTKDPLEDRNVLLVRVRKTQEAANRFFDDSVCEVMCRIMGIKPITDTVGCQYLTDKGDILIEIWLKDNIQASKFASDA